MICSENCSNVSCGIFSSIASDCNLLDIRLEKFCIELMSGLLAGIVICLTRYDFITFLAALQFWLRSSSWRNNLLSGFLHLLNISGNLFLTNSVKKFSFMCSYCSHKTVPFLYEMVTIMCATLPPVPAFASFEVQFSSILHLFFTILFHVEL